MKMLKRTLAMMLALVMMLSVMPFTAFATESTDVTSEPTEAVVDAPASDPTVPETSVPETSVPETSVPETSVPETSVPEETIPETTVAEETVPEVTVADEVPAVNEVPMMLSLAKSVDASSFIKVFHLDCGRKYFTVDQIKELIDAISAKGFSHMELAIGNDGLRLLLDDMTITANGTTYNSDTIKSGIQSGNKNYSHSGEWTEAEMDTIIAYAKTKGIEIIPLVNNPGHMDSILAAMKACGINGYYARSARTVDLENDAAVAFTQALVLKYAEYFAEKGCNYFNIGADEYANDYHTSDSTGMGFGYLIDNKKYGNFITYVNELVADICALGVTPIAFNDGIYFRENTSFGTFDTRLVVAAWTGGWGGIKPASTTFLQNKGHQILNTNERWYYVLGRKQASNSTYCYESALSNAKSESVTTVTDHKSGIASIGAMQCVWCDTPSVNYETYKSNVMTLINTLADSNPTYFTGPNEVTPAPEPEVPEDVGVTDDTTGISVSAEGVTSLTVTPVKETQLPVVEGAVEGKVLAWDMTPATADGSYTGEATVAVPVPEGWDGNQMGAFVVNDDATVTLIDGAVNADGLFEFTMPHFSVGGVYEIAPAAATPVEIQLEVGDTHEFVVEGKNLSGTYTPDPAGVATVDVKYEQVPGETIVTLGNQITPTNTSGWSATGVIKSGNYYMVMNGSTLSATTNIAEATVFTVTRSGSNTWTIKSGDRFVRYSSSSVSSSTTSYAWSYSSSSGFYRSSYGSTYSLNYSSNSWTTTRNASNDAHFYSISTATTAPVDESTVTFTAIGVGETYVTVDGTSYKIVVNKKEVSATVTVGDKWTYSDSSATAPVVSDSSVAAAEIVNGTLTVTAKAAGEVTVTTDNAVYTINVVEFDPSTVTPLTVEYWITNIITRTVESTSENPVTTQQISAAAEGVATANGADINAMMPEWTVKRDGDSGEDRNVEFWHVRLLDKTQTNNSTSKTEEQTTDSADDETTSGDAVTRVRYYDPGDGNGRRWQMLSGTNWLDVDLEDNQIVAYYMEVVDIQNANGSTELHVNAADWGKLGDGSPASSYADTSKYCSISLQIVYEDGSGNPATTTAADLDSKTLIFNYWDNGRGIGTFAFDTLGQFNIYQITAETGAVSVTFSGGAWGTAQVNRFTWDNNEKVVWSGESETASVYNNASHPSNTDPLDNLMWNENKEAILLRVYVRAVETEDSLTVVYYDEKFGDTLYSYNIHVDAGNDFTKNMIGTPANLENGRIDVTGCGVVNTYAQPQYFQTDLTQVPEAKGKYDSELYQYTGSEISEDGKTLYLYYNINTDVLKPNFVVDFGLPITFNLSDVTNTPALVKSASASARYGTVSYNSSAKTFTYTPTKILQNVDVLSITLTFDGEAPALTNVGVTPATTVYYEEGFLLNNASGWSHSTATIANQSTVVLGETGTNNYGYDGAYASKGTDTGYIKGDAGASTSFTFTGTGFQLYGNSNSSSGYVTVFSQGNLSKLYMINTALTAGTSDATNQQTGGTYYSLPFISETDLPYGTYTVQIKQTNGDKDIYLDGVRILNTINDQTDGKDNIYFADQEDKPDFYELRDYVLNAIDVEKLEDSQYTDTADRVLLVDKVSEMAGQVYNALGDSEKAVVINTDGTTFTAGQAQDLLDNGPKNELYLYPGQTLAFSVTTNRVVQLGLKSPTGSASFDLTVNGTKQSLNSLSASVDMFYDIAAQGGTSHTVNISVAEGSGPLSVTLLKICDDPNFTFNALTQEDIENTLLNIYGLTDDETPVEPEVPEETTKPTEPEVEETTKPTKPSKPSKPTKPTKPTEPAKPTKPTEPAKPSKPTEPAKPSKPTEPAKPSKPTEPEIEETKPSKPAKPAKPGKDEQKKEKVATLKITYVSMFGRKIGTATLTKEGNGRCIFSAAEIRAAAPAGRMAIWMIPTMINYGTSASIVVPVI